MTALLLALGVFLQAETSPALTPDEVKAALKEKRAVHYVVKTTFSWRRNSFGGDLVAFASTPYSRLTWLAQTARERFETVDEELVAETLKDPSLCVSTPRSEDAVVQSLVLVPRNVKELTPESVIKSADTSTSIHEVYNKLGGQWKEASHTACFQDWKGKELDVVVVYQGEKPLRAPLPRRMR